MKILKNKYFKAIILALIFSILIFIVITNSNFIKTFYYQQNIKNSQLILDKAKEYTYVSNVYNAFQYDDNVDTAYKLELENFDIFLIDYNKSENASVSAKEKYEYYKKYISENGFDVYAKKEEDKPECFYATIKSEAKNCIVWSNKDVFIFAEYNPIYEKQFKNIFEEII